MGAQLSLFGRPKPAAVDPPPRREPPPPEPWRGFAGLDEEFRRRTAENDRKLAAYREAHPPKRRADSDGNAPAAPPAAPQAAGEQVPGNDGDDAFVAASAQPEPQAETERTATPENPPACAPVVQLAEPGQKTERSGEPCEECCGRGRWQGELGLVECWRCYGTGLEHPTPTDRREARACFPEPSAPHPAAVSSSTCLLCHAPADRAAGARTTLCPDCQARLERAGWVQVAREQLAGKARAEGHRTYCPRCAAAAGSCLTCQSAVETDPRIGPCAAAGWSGQPAGQMQES